MFSHANARSLACAIVCLVLTSGYLRAQDPPPAQPFQAVHLLWIDTQQSNSEDAVRSALAGLNRAITKAGCSACTYQLWKVVDAAPGSYNYVQTSNWPSGTVYDRIHASPEYLRASKDWEKLRSVVTREAYNRYTAVALDDGPTMRAAASSSAECTTTRRGGLAGSR